MYVLLVYLPYCNKFYACDYFIMLIQYCNDYTCNTVLVQKREEPENQIFLNWSVRQIKIINGTEIFQNWTNVGRTLFCFGWKCPVTFSEYMSTVWELLGISVPLKPVSILLYPWLLDKILRKWSKLPFILNWMCCGEERAYLGVLWKKIVLVSDLHVHTYYIFGELWTKWNVVGDFNCKVSKTFVDGVGVKFVVRGVNNNGVA